MSTAELTYCVICFAEPGECDHNGHRALPDMVYEVIPDDAGKRYQWRVPDSERWRVDNPPSSWPEHQRREKIEEAIPVDHLIVQLSDWLDVDDSLEDQLRDTYEHDPLKTSRLVRSIIAKIESRAVTRPGGLLVKRLREIRSKK
jgi:hypothetical protein